MKLSSILFTFMLGALLHTSYNVEAVPQLDLPTSETIFSASDTRKIISNQPCLKIFEIQCLNGAPLVVGIGEIAEPLDTMNFCQKKVNEGVLDENCGIDECADRLDVLYGFKAAPTTGDECTTQRW